MSPPIEGEYTPTPNTPIPYDDPDAQRGRIIALHELQVAAVRMHAGNVPIPAIAAKLRLDEARVEALIVDSLRAAMRTPAEAIIARHHQVIGDMITGLYPAILRGDPQSTSAMTSVLGYEANLRGIIAPKRTAPIADESEYADNAASLLNEIGATVPDARAAAPPPAADDWTAEPDEWRTPPEDWSTVE